MSPPTSSGAARRGPAETTRFRCRCGRSVVAQRGSEAARTRQCSSCRHRQPAEQPLHRT